MHKIKLKVFNALSFLKFLRIVIMQFARWIVLRSTTENFYLYRIIFYGLERILIPSQNIKKTPLYFSFTVFITVFFFVANI